MVAKKKKKEKKKEKRKKKRIYEQTHLNAFEVKQEIWVPIVYFMSIFRINFSIHHRSVLGGIIHRRCGLACRIGSSMQGTIILGGS
jgi:hypothetical protein